MLAFPRPRLGGREGGPGRGRWGTCRKKGRHVRLGNQGGFSGILVPARGVQSDTPPGHCGLRRLAAPEIGEERRGGGTHPFRALVKAPGTLQLPLRCWLSQRLSRAFQTLGFRGGKALLRGWTSARVQAPSAQSHLLRWHTAFQSSRPGAGPEAGPHSSSRPPGASCGMRTA